MTAIVTISFWSNSNFTIYFVRCFQALLFNISKPFVCVSQTTIPVEALMVDCFVSSFRINYRNSQHFDDCLSPTTPVIFSVVYVKGLYTIVRQVKNIKHENSGKISPVKHCNTKMYHYQVLSIKIKSVKKFFSFAIF